MKEHVAKIAAACFYDILRLHQVRRRIGQEVTQQLVLALIMSRLDYCNSVLAALPTSTLQPLQRVGLSRSDHVTPTPIHPAALAAGQLQNKVQAVLPRQCHPIRAQPGVSDGNSPLIRRQQITFQAGLL